MLPYSLVPMCSGLQQFTSFGPILCLAYPEHFLHHIRTSPCLSTLLPNVVFSIFPNFLTKILVLYISPASSCINFLFRISRTDTCLLPHTTLFDASYSRSSFPRKPTFLSTWASVFHNPSTPLPGSGSWPHTATPPHFPAAFIVFAPAFATFFCLTLLLLLLSHLPSHCLP